MSGLLNNSLFLSTAAAAGGYQVERSLRFNSSDSAKCARTYSTGSSTTTQTFSAWVKRAKLGATGCFWSGYDGSAAYGAYFQFDSADTITVILGGASLYQLTTTQVFRDPSSWYHIVLTIDTNNGTSSDRIRLYVNGSRVTTFSTASYPTSGYACQFAMGNANNTIGTTWGSSGYSFFDGYLADVHFIDGQALTPSSFTEVSATTGQLIPKAYTGTFGTNGFWLKFSDNSNNTAATLGKDYSPNGNNWTPNNLQTTTGGPTSVAAASGALPIYNTTDTYGATKGSGTRTDSNSSSIVLAIPMDGANNGTTFTDESATIKGSGSAKTITRYNAVTSTSQSKFYGSSGYFDGNGDYLQTPYSTDFNFGSSSFTIEAFVRVDATGTKKIIANYLAATATTGNDLGWILGINTSNQFEGVLYSGTSAVGLIQAGSVSTGRWYHVAYVRSGSNFTLYVDGVSVGTATNSSSHNVNTGWNVSIGYGHSGDTQYMNGYLQDVRIYKGVAKYTSNFNPPSSTQNSTVAAGNDSLVDTPTSYGTDTGAGGEVRGNYCTLNPLDTGTVTLTNGNLDVTFGTAARGTRATLGITSGKYYFEMTNGSAGAAVGVAYANANITTNYAGSDANAWIYNGGDGKIYNNGAASGSNALFTTNDIIGVAINMDAGVVTFYKNNSAQPTTVTGLSGTVFPVVTAGATTGVQYLNFGQRPFAYTAPSGFKALCDTNLTAPVVAKPSTVMDVALWTGNGGTQTVSYANSSFSPDFIWFKSRSIAMNNHVVDVVRGTDANGYLVMQTDATFGESVFDTSWHNTYGKLTSISNNSFTVVSGTSNGGFNTNNVTYAGWAWDAGTTTSSNVAGSITSQVRANASAGFSVVGYNSGSAGNYTVGHGLGVKPQFIITKARNGSSFNWAINHVSIATTVNKYLTFTTSATFDNGSAVWGASLADTNSTTFGISSANAVEASKDCIAYCFAPVVGYGNGLSYVGNGSTDGPFCYLGFLPKLILIKCSSTTGNWVLLDTEREGYNVDNDPLFPNLSDAEATTDLLDITSNGFKIRSTNADVNASAATYIVYAWASNPFQYSRAR